MSTELPPVVVEELLPQPFVGARREVALGELDEFIATTAARARAVASAASASDGDPFTIFHRPVTSETAGEVEVGAPLGHLRVEDAALALGELPGGPAATITVTGARAEFPAVLAVYEAIRHWAREHDRALADPPREVYVQEPPGLKIVWPLAAG